MTRWYVVAGLAALLAMGSRPGMTQDVDSPRSQGAVSESEDDAEMSEEAVESEPSEEADAPNQEPVYHIQVLRHPYEISRFYRQGGGNQPLAFMNQDPCESESVLLNPYLISSFYRSDSSSRFTPWFVASPRRHRSIRQRGDTMRLEHYDTDRSPFECESPHER